MSHLAADLAFAVRRLLRRPGLLATTLPTLALGLGAAIAIFSVVDGVLLAPLPFPSSSQLVRVEERHADGRRLNLTGAAFADVAAATRSLAATGAYRLAPVNVSVDGGAEAITAARVSAGFFDVLRVSPRAGRVLVHEDSLDGAARVVVLTEGLWRRMPGGEAGALGRPVRLDGEPFVVVGVIPDTQAFPAEAEAWIAATPAQSLATNRRAHLFTAIARMKSGVEASVASAELDTLAAAWTTAPGENAVRLTATPLRDRLTESLRPALLATTAAVALLLAIACANVALVLAAHGAQRRREMAVRGALGACGGRLVRLLLLESLVLALAGAALAWPVALALLRAFLAAAPADLPRVATVQLDGGAFAFAVLAAFASAALFGTWPAREAARTDLRASLGHAVAGRVSGRAGQRLVAAEVALLVVLLCGAGLLGRTMSALRDVPLGVRPEGVMTFYVSPSGPGYASRAERGRFVDRVLARLQETPGAAQVSVVNGLPTRGLPSTVFAIDGVRGEDDERSADVLAVGPGYFPLMGVPIRSGRALAASDADGAPVVAVVSAAAAQRFWPGGSPLGHRLTLLDWDTPLEATVVGVVDDVRYRGPDAEMRPAVYFSHGQFADRVMGWYVLARPREGAPEALVPRLRDAMAAVDPRQPISSVRTLEDVLSAAMAPRRLLALVVGAFGASALLLVLVGLQGLVSFGVVERTREIGVRLALGADPGRVRREVVGDGLRIALQGLLVGLPLAFAGARAMASLLFGVRPADPATLTAVAALVAATALAAAWWPARRAARIEPSRALRSD